MAILYKVKEHDSKEDAIIYRQTSADIVDFDPSRSQNLDKTNLQEAVEDINTKVENSATKKEMENEVNAINTDIIKLSNVVSGKATTKTLYTTIVAKGFVGNTAPYKQKISVPEIKETDNPIISIVEDDAYMSALDQRDSWGNINRITTENGFITVYCYEALPNVDLNIQIKVIR